MCFDVARFGFSYLRLMNKKKLAEVTPSAGLIPLL
jgi:hypothetical protein